MKNIVLVASVIFTLNSIMADTPITQEPPHELKIGGAVISPSKTADWTSASGGEIQFRFWNSKKYRYRIFNRSTGMGCCFQHIYRFRYFGVCLHEY